MERQYHIPVLLNELLLALSPKPGEHFIDCTLGDGGHAMVILEKSSPDGKLLGIDLDPLAITEVRKRLLIFGKRLIAVTGNFRDLSEIYRRTQFPEPAGIYFDLGFSSAHIEARKRGFTFQKNEPLDMTYAGMEVGGGVSLTAAEIVGSWTRDDIAKVLRNFGEERYADKIAQEIVNTRKKKRILTTFDLVDVIKRAVPPNYEGGRIHPATRTFLALRMVVNDELGNLEAVLPQTLELLPKGGKLAVISFQSLEDRIVKQFMKKNAELGKIEILTKKPITPSDEEIRSNPRCRSAKLRVAEKR